MADSNERTVISYREASRLNYGISLQEGKYPNAAELSTGALMRIADALEVMNKASGPHAEVVRLQKEIEMLSGKVSSLNGTVNGQKGVINSLRKQLRQKGVDA